MGGVAASMSITIGSAHASPSDYSCCEEPAGADQGISKPSLRTARIPLVRLDELAYGQ